MFEDARTFDEDSFRMGEAAIIVPKPNVEALIAARAFEKRARQVAARYLGPVCLADRAMVCRRSGGMGYSRRTDPARAYFVLGQRTHRHDLDLFHLRTAS